METEVKPGTHEQKFLPLQKGEEFMASMENRYLNIAEENFNFN